MRKWIAIALTVGSLWPGTAFAQGRKRMISERLGWAGFLTTITGVLIMPSYNFEGKNDTILGQDYCVTDYSDGSFVVKGRACEMTGSHVKVGAYVALAGGAMMAIGFSKVTVAPMVGPHVKGAKLTVQW